MFLGSFPFLCDLIKMTCISSWIEIDIHTKESFVCICCQKMVWIEELRNLNMFLFFFFSLGAVVQDSLIQCLWWLHITELTAKMRVDTIYLVVPINLLKQEYWLINVKCLNNVKWIMNILKNLTTETNIPKNFPPFGMFFASLFIYFYLFIYYHSE